MAIDEKKLIEDLNKWLEVITKYCDKFNYHDALERYEEAYYIFADIIDVQPKLSLENKTSDKWIPVTERLPEENKEVLIQIWYGTMTVGCLSDNRWISEAWPYQIHEVAAWMPLPEPYKEKEK